MPRFTHAQSGAVVSVSDATAKLLSGVWRPLDATEASGVSDEPFDPAKHNGDVVLAHLEAADDAERDRVLAAERAGKNRKTIVGE